MSRRIDGDSEDMAIQLWEISQRDLSELREKLEEIAEFKGSASAKLDNNEQQISDMKEEIKSLGESKQDKLEILVLAKTHIWKAIGGLFAVWAAIQWENLKEFLSGILK